MGDVAQARLAAEAASVSGDLTALGRDTEVALAALYLRGLPRPFEVQRSGWGVVLRVARRLGWFGSSGAPDDLGAGLAQCGLNAEAALLRDARVWAEATRWVEAGCVITPLSSTYPSRWATFPWAPPALWCDGPSLAPPPRHLAIVGSREIAPEVDVFAAEVADVAHSLGYGVVSGGARGTDTAAARGTAGASAVAIEILPGGLAAVPPHHPFPTWRWSVCAPDEPFSRNAAMERNALIYGMAEAAVVAHCRFKAGGSWHGAVAALRQRTTRVVVRHDPADLAHRALMALGAVPLGEPLRLAEAIARPPLQRALFTFG